MVNLSKTQKASELEQNFSILNLLNCEFSYLRPLNGFSPVIDCHEFQIQTKPVLHFKFMVEVLSRLIT